jgi:hypothetical protein
VTVVLELVLEPNDAPLVMRVFIVQQLQQPDFRAGLATERWPITTQTRPHKNNYDATCCGNKRAHFRTGKKTHETFFILDDLHSDFIASLRVSRSTNLPKATLWLTYT